MAGLELEHFSFSKKAQVGEMVEIGGKPVRARDGRGGVGMERGGGVGDGDKGGGRQRGGGGGGEAEEMEWRGKGYLCQKAELKKYPNTEPCVVQSTECSTGLKGLNPVS